jgi:hypothetical protein
MPLRPSFCLRCQTVAAVFYGLAAGRHPPFFVLDVSGPDPPRSLRMLNFGRMAPSEKVRRLRDVRLAVLDTDVIHDLARRPHVARERLCALRKEGLVPAIAHRVRTEIEATRNEEKRERLLNTVLSQVEAFFPFEALELVQMEIDEPDPAAWLGAQELLPVRHLETLTFAEEAVEVFSAANQEQRARIKVMAPGSDPKVKTLEGLASFAEHVRLQEVEQGWW